MATVTKEPSAPPSSSSTAPPEDESLKRNTDCVYFLASPLTCKKGSECEYRHSEYARVNPRDCWYWLNGNCLNPKCSFRHPPLDSLMGSPAGNFAAPPLPVPPPAVAVTSAPQSSAKQAVPCIFFQKGYCLKGDRCPFMHGPNSPSAKIQQVPSTTPANEPLPFKKVFGGVEKPKMNIQANPPKVADAPVQPNATPKVETAMTRDGMFAGRRGPPPSTVVEEPPRHKETTAPPIDNGNSRSRTARANRSSSLDDQNYQNGWDADDSLRESSPGFDVLVDDKLRDEEYYQHEEQYVRMRSHEGRSLNEFEMSHHDDYSSVADVDPEVYHSRRGYDSYDRLQDRYAWEQRRTSSDRSLGEPAPYERRRSYKSQSPDFVQNSDLRSRLSKPRRVNGLKSVVNPDYSRDNHVDDRGYRGTRRDTRRSPPHESSRGSRLQGRIKLPRRSPPLNASNLHSDREHERGRNWGRLSPSRPQVSSQQGRLRDRLSVRIQDDNSEGRSLRGSVTRRDSSKDNGTNFAGPKSLAELKGTKQPDTKQQQQLKSQQSVSGGKLRDTVLASSVGSEGDLSFEGPKPLSEILKRKRDSGNAASGVYSSNKEESKQNENKDLSGSDENSAGDAEKPTALTSAPKQAQVGEEENKPVMTAEGDEEAGEISNKKMKLNEGDSSIPDNKTEPDVQEGLDAAEEGEHEPEHEHEHEHEHENENEEEYYQGDVDYEYEQDDGEGYNLNDGETVDHEDDFMEEDDGDDFAKKIGVSF